MRTYQEKKIVYDKLLEGRDRRILGISLFAYAVVEGRLSSYENFNNRNIKTRIRNCI